MCVVHLEAREALERAQHVIQLVASRRVQARPLLHPLEVDDVALESEGRRQQVAVAHRGAIRRLGEPAAGLAACPFAHDLVDAGRNATGRREHGVDGQLRGRPAEVQGGDLGHRFPIERQELADVDAGHLAQEPGECGRVSAWTVRAKHEQRSAVRRGDERGELVDHRWVSRVEVVEHEQRLLRHVGESRHSIA